jgi:hypothetical protein
MSAVPDSVAIRAVVTDYLEGMIHGDNERLRAAMHPLCMQAGHVNGEYEFINRDAVIAAISGEPRQAAGTPIVHEIVFIDITGDMAAVKVVDECFGSVWTDYLTLIRHEGKWQIVMKAFYSHGGG